MKKNFIVASAFLASFSFSTLAFAQTTATATDPCKNGISTLGDLFNFVTCTINGSVIPLLITLALLFFIFGVVKFIMNNDNEEARSQGKQFMIWGIIALFVIFSVWGLVNILTKTLGTDKNSSIPTLPTSYK